MATLDIEIQDFRVVRGGFDSPQTVVNILDGEVQAKPGVLRSTGFLETRSANPGTLVTYYCHNTSSDISGYRNLWTPISGLGVLETRTVTFAGSPIPTGEQTIEKYVTDSPVMNGISSKNSTTTVVVRARKVVPGTQVCKVRFEIYHRTSDGTETLLADFTTPDLTSGFTNYSGDVTVYRSWGLGERLVGYLIGINLGIPA